MPAPRCPPRGVVRLGPTKGMCALQTTHAGASSSRVAGGRLCRGGRGRRLGGSAAGESGAGRWTRWLNTEATILFIVKAALRARRVLEDAPGRAAPSATSIRVTPQAPGRPPHQRATHIPPTRGPCDSGTRRCPSLGPVASQGPTLHYSGDKTTNKAQPRRDRQLYINSSWISTQFVASLIFT